MQYFLFNKKFGGAPGSIYMDSTFTIVKHCLAKQPTLQDKIKGKYYV